MSGAQLQAARDLSWRATTLEGQRPLRSSEFDTLHGISGGCDVELHERHALAAMVQVAEHEQAGSRPGSAAPPGLVLVRPEDPGHTCMCAADNIERGFRGIEIEQVVHRLRHQLRDVLCGGEVGVLPLARLGDTFHQGLIEVCANTKGARGDARLSPCGHPLSDGLWVPHTDVHASVAEKKNAAHCAVPLHRYISALLQALPERRVPDSGASAQ
mmetsp:Transcript_75411/g.161562  ORF Transcript_75411/g.161562 Transcript_75411/m.161562 type:complete len:214 (+) Transcript_75411:781-1422(+)